MKKFYILVRKEVKELLTPQVLLPMLGVVLAFMFIGKVVGKESAKTNQRQQMAFMDLDQSQASAVVGLSAKNYFVINEYQGLSPEELVQKARANNEKIAVIVPKGFEQGLKDGQPQKLQTYTILNNFSFLGSKTSQQAAAAVLAANEAVSNQLLAQKNLGTEAASLKNPIKSEDFVLVGDKQAQVNPAAIAGFISQQTTYIPIVLFLVIIFASQMIMTSMAAEKENKTLETLLSAPVSRQSIIAAKLIGAGLVALITAAIYLVGMRYYINGVTGGGLQAAADTTVKAAAVQLGLVMGTADYILLGLSLFFGILSALSVSIILGSFAEDAKSAQGIIAPLTVLILIPYILTMFLDLNSISPTLRWLVFAIPFSHPFLAAPNLLLHKQANVWWGILYMTAFFSVCVYIASKIFASDKILTMRLSFKKKPLF